MAAEVLTGMPWGKSMSFLAFWKGNQAEGRRKKCVGGYLPAFLPQGVQQAEMGGN